MAFDQGFGGGSSKLGGVATGTGTQRTAVRATPAPAPTAPGAAASQPGLISGVTINGETATTIRLSQLRRAWSTMTVEERSRYINQFAGLGYDVSTPAAQQSVWDNFSMQIAENYANGKGITQNISDYLKQLQSGETVAATNPGALNRQRYDSTVTTIKQYLGANGITLPDSSIANYATTVMKGTNTTDSIMTELRDKFVKSKYPAWADQIDKGMNMEDIAANYIQRKAQLLEMNPAEVKLTDGDIDRALSAVDDRGQPTYVPIWKFEERLRSTDRYYQTQQARNNVLDVAGQLRQEWGR